MQFCERCVNTRDAPVACLWHACGTPVPCLWHDCDMPVARLWHASWLLLHTINAQNIRLDDDGIGVNTYSQEITNTACKLYKLYVQVLLCFGEQKYELFRRLHECRPTKFWKGAPDICGPSVWNVHHVTLMTPGILRWLVGFWKICVLPAYNKRNITPWL